MFYCDVRQIRLRPVLKEVMYLIYSWWLKCLTFSWALVIFFCTLLAIFPADTPFPIGNSAIFIWIVLFANNESKEHLSQYQIQQINFSLSAGALNSRPYNNTRPGNRMNLHKRTRYRCPLTNDNSAVLKGQYTIFLFHTNLTHYFRPVVDFSVVLQWDV